jgi:zinc protease
VRTTALLPMIVLSSCSLVPAVMPRALTSSVGADAPTIEFEKFELANGMKVILAPDRRLPLVAINSWFYVGAKDEPPGRSGFAHLFEHLMFMGTERVPLGQFDRTMEAVGGTNNASTDFDRTNYYSSGPAHILPTLLWLDADRLEDLGRAMTQEKLDAQRAIVRNERRQSIENVPYGKSELRLTEMMFQPGHPYHYEVIGSHEELEAATLEDVKEFFANFYVPNNASLVVCGDFDPAAVKPIVEAQFGTLPRGAAPPRRDLAVRELDREERFTMLDTVDAPMVRFAWHSPIAYQDGDADMILLARVLGEDQSGRLYRRLVLDEGLASEVSVGQQSLIARSIFRVDVRALPGADLDRIEAIVHEEIDRVAADGVPDDELARALARQELDVLAPFEQLLSKADKLNEYEFYFGRPDGFDADLARFRAVTGSRIEEFASATFGAKGRAVVRVLPQEPDKSASARDARPADFKAAPFTPPTPAVARLDNGVTIESYAVGGVPRVEFEIEFAPPPARAGVRIDPPGREGMLRLLADLLLEGAGELDGPSFSAALAALGAELNAQAARDRLALHLSVPAANFDAALDLAAQVVFAPKLDLAAFDRVKAIALEGLKQRNASPRAVAGQVGDRLFFGERHPLGSLEEGTMASVGSLSHADVVGLHRALVGSNHARIYVAGQLDSVQTDAIARRFAALRPAAPGYPFAGSSGSTVPRAASKLPALYLVDRPGAVQTAVQFTWQGPSRGGENRVAAELLAIVMGGSFTSRLNQNLREDKGYSYGAGCGVDAEHSNGKVSAFSAVRADVTGASLKEFLAEFARIRGGDLTAEESQRAKALYRVQQVERFESLRSRIRALTELARFGLSVDAVTKDIARAEALDHAAVAALAKSVFAVESGVLVLVGDAQTIVPQLEGLGFAAPIRVTAEGAPIAP